MFMCERACLRASVQINRTRGTAAAGDRRTRALKAEEPFPKHARRTLADELLLRIDPQSPGPKKCLIEKAAVAAAEHAMDESSARTTCVVYFVCIKKSIALQRLHA